MKTQIKTLQMKYLLCIVIFLVSGVLLWGQDFSYNQFKDHKDKYAIPLKTLLEDAQKDLDIKLVIDKKVEPYLKKTVTMAPWKYWSNVELRLAYILAPLDLSFEKVDEKTWRIFEPWYYVRPEAEGKAHLERLLRQYSNKETWEARKKVLTNTILKELDLQPFPERTDLHPRFSAVRTHDGYNVRNVTLEIIPGYYLCGDLYEPILQKGPWPIVLCPHGHGRDGRLSADHQKIGGNIARMGGICFTYSMFAWITEESPLKLEDHRDPISGTIQTWTTMRVLDFLTALPNVKKDKIGITGASGGGTQTFLGTALDSRITVTVPVVMVSSHFYGGCPCESGLPFHIYNGCSCNAEIAAMAAPRPIKLIAVTTDWTKNTPLVEFPYLQKIYSYYGAKDKVEFAISKEQHGYGTTQQKAMYPFMAKHLGLDISQVDDSKITIEPREVLYGFGKDLVDYPKNGIKNISEVKESFKRSKK